MIKVFSPLLLLLFLAACTQAPAPTIDRTPTAQARAVAGEGEYMVKRGDTLYRIARENGLDHRELAAINNIDNPAALREGQILRLRPVGLGEGAQASGAPTAMPIGVGGGVEVRPLDGSTVTESTTGSVANTIREPKGGKEAYSDEAYARLNNQPPVAASTASPASETSAASVPEAAGTAQVEGVIWAWPSAASIKVGYNVAGNKGIDFAGKQGDPVLSAGEGRVLYVGDALAGYGKLVIVKHSTDHLSVYAHNSRILVKEGQAVKLGQKIAEMGSSGTDSVKLHFEIRKQGKPVDPMPFLPKR